MSRIADARAALTDADRRRIERIVEENHALAKWAVGKWSWMCPHVDRDDVESAMLEALWVAAVTWEPARGTLGTYAGNQMRWAAQRLGSRSRRPGGLRLAPDGYEPLRLDLEDDDGHAIRDRLRDPRDLLERCESEIDVERVLAGPLLSRRERDIIERRCAGYTFGEIGDHYGITRERVRQVIVKAATRAGITA